MLWFKKKETKDTGGADATKETKEVPCPNCRVSEETLRILKEKSQTADKKENNHKL